MGNLKNEKYTHLLNTIFGTVLVDMHVIDIYSKYASVYPLKDKKGIEITNAFTKLLDESNRKTNKMWVDKGNEFCNRSVKPWLQYNDIEMYSTCKKRKSIITERFIRTLKTEFINISL